MFNNIAGERPNFGWAVNNKGTYHLVPTAL